MKQKIFLTFLALTFGMASSAWALEKDANGVYQISSKQDLIDFASKVNGENELNAKAVLTKNIDLKMSHGHLLAITIINIQALLMGRVMPSVISTTQPQAMVATIYLAMSEMLPSRISA